jgi:hypothetical protein
VWRQTGSRPAAPKDLGFASAYVFGAVCPLEGKAAALIMAICNTAAMNHHLCEISSQVAADAHAVVILDGAGWHRSQGLVVPSNITLLELPPYSPERAITASGTAPANNSSTKRCRTACDQSGSLAARKVSVKRSDMMLVPTDCSIIRIVAHYTEPHRVESGYASRGSIRRCRWDARSC